LTDESGDMNVKVQTAAAAGNAPELIGAEVSRRRSRLVMGFLAIATVAGLLCPLALQFDHSLSQSVRGWNAPGDLRKAIALSEAFAHGIGVTFILLSVFVVAVDRRKMIWIAILITALSGGLANALKATVVRVRPHSVDLVVDAGSASTQQGDAGANSQSAPALVASSFWDSRQRSFPSGHTATAWGLAIGLSLAFRNAWWLFAVLATLASFQRLESGAHYLSDVFAGAAIAFLVAACILSIPRIRKEIAQDSP
jgi:membrane-associated phospholipid phosphatase